MPNLTKQIDTSYVIDREVTAQTVNTTTAETTVFTHTIPANTLGTNKILRFTMAFDLLINSGTPILTFKVKFGATTLWAAATNAYSTSGSRRPGYMILTMFAQNSASIQALGGGLWINSNNTSSVTAGIGSITDDSIEREGPFSGSATEATTANKDFVVTIQMDVSNVAVEFKKNGAVLEVL